MTAPDANNQVRRDRNATVDVGDADAVEKTTYVGDAHGTEPGDAPEQNQRVTAAVESGGGLGPLGWIALVLGALALIAYATGLFT